MNKQEHVFPWGRNLWKHFFLFNISRGVKDGMLPSDASARSECDDRGREVLLDSTVPLATSKPVLLGFISAPAP